MAFELVIALLNCIVAHAMLGQLLVGAGRDVTQVFQMYHKDSTEKCVILRVYGWQAADILCVRTAEKFYIGDLENRELPSFPPAGSVSSRVVVQYRSSPAPSATP